ncbi:MAG: hypothetical protein N3A01_08710 [Bacteroidales bacterium]|nr:hypothetical protein [Bacteroidales bacterium]
MILLLPKSAKISKPKSFGLLEPNYYIVLYIDAYQPNVKVDNKSKTTVIFTTVAINANEIKDISGFFIFYSDEPKDLLYTIFIYKVGLNITNDFSALI